LQPASASRRPKPASASRRPKPASASRRPKPAATSGGRLRRPRVARVMVLLRRYLPSGRLLAILGLLSLVGLGLYIAGMYYRASQQRRAALKALGRHDYLAARNHLNASLDAWPNHPTTHLLLARAARLAGFFEEADRQLALCRRCGGSGDDIALE